MARSERMFEATVSAGRIHEVGGAKLLDTSQALHWWRIDDLALERSQVDVTMDWVADDHAVARMRFEPIRQMSTARTQNLKKVPSRDNLCDRTRVAAS